MLPESPPEIWRQVYLAAVIVQERHGGQLAEGGCREIDVTDVAPGQPVDQGGRAQESAGSGTQAKEGPGASTQTSAAGSVRPLLPVGLREDTPGEQLIVDTFHNHNPGVEQLCKHTPGPVGVVIKLSQRHRTTSYRVLSIYLFVLFRENARIIH